MFYLIGYCLHSDVSLVSRVSNDTLVIYVCDTSLPSEIANLRFHQKYLLPFPVPFLNSFRFFQLSIRRVSIFSMSLLISFSSSISELVSIFSVIHSPRLNFVFSMSLLISLLSHLLIASLAS